MFRGIEADKYDRQYTDRYLFQRIFSYFKPRVRAMIYIMLCTFLIAFVVALRPVLIADGVQSLEDQGLGTPLQLLLGALFVSAVLEYGANYLRRALFARVVGDVVATLRKDSFAAAMDRDLAFYDKNKSGKIVSRITSDTQEFGQVILTISDVIAQLGAVVFLTYILLTREWRLTLLLALTTPVIVGAAQIFRRMVRNTSRQSSRALAVVNDSIQESVTGISVAKSFRREQMLYGEFSRVNRQAFSINMRRGFVIALIFPVLNVLAGLATGLIVYAGAAAALDPAGAISIATWFLFVQGVDRFWFPFITLAEFWSRFQQGLAAAERVFALIDTENTVRQTGSEPAQNIHGEIEFRNVLFQYEAGQPVLKDFDLHIRRGESVAFVGHTGAGKSTIAKLIARFYEFQGGELLVDGQDIRTFEVQSYRARLGIVPQQPFLFSGTIMDNIRYGRPDATDAEIEAIARSIGGGEWLETIADGLHADVGERGAKLSMGQRQLVSLLRVLVEKPAIFVLDEATASVDPFTEMQIQEALNLILAQSTSILIAHRLSTVRSADRIIVLKGGEIIEAGDHEALMAQGGHYAELYNTYFRHQSLSYIESAKTTLTAELSAD